MELVIVLTLDCVRERRKLAWGCGAEDERSRGVIYFPTYP